MRIYRSIIAATALPLVLSLTGCIIVTDIDGDGEEYGDSWEHRQRDNHAYITDLRLGTAMDVVRGDLGRPDFSEGYASKGREVVVVRYRTHHRHSDGETTLDETTPLVFVDGMLVGWGEIVVNDYAATRYSSAN